MREFFRYWLQRPAPTRLPAIPSGYRVYAIGDIHGRDDLLGILLRQIEDDLTRGEQERAILVFLGDLIDRGPSSFDVLERLSRYERPGVRCVFLLGNHEEAFLRVLDGEANLLGNWLRFGGEALVTSYGLDPDELQKQSRSQALRSLRSAVPNEHIKFLRTFHDSFRAGDYFFAHAGARPGVPLVQQSPSDLRWIRSPFLEHAEPFEAMVVHGHTIIEAVDEQPHRIGIDTGAYKTGVLSGLALEGSRRWVLEAKL